MVNTATGQELAKLALEILPEKWGYIYGQSGALWTKAKQKNLEGTTDPKYEMGRKYGSKWIGHQVADCSGLVVYLCAQMGFSVPHGSNSMWDGSLSKKGCITTSDIPVGALVFKLRGADDYYHVGIYVGNGKVVEAKSTYYGIVESGLSDWTHYGLLKKLSYSDEEVTELHTGNAIVDVPNDGTVNVRKSASTKSTKVCTLREGESCNVLSVDGDWAKVELRTEGYVMTKYLKNTEG